MDYVSQLFKVCIYSTSTVNSKNIILLISKYIQPCLNQGRLKNLPKFQRYSRYLWKRLKMAEARHEEKKKQGTKMLHENYIFPQLRGTKLNLQNKIDNTLFFTEKLSK